MVRPAPEPRVAILGGDRRQEGRWSDYGRAVYFQAPRSGGNGQLRRLKDALRAGSIRLVVILARWNAHSVTRAVQRVCRTRGVPVVVVP